MSLEHVLIVLNIRCCMKYYYYFYPLIGSVVYDDNNNIFITIFNLFLPSGSDEFSPCFPF